jgi:hypothetical protein
VISGLSTVTLARSHNGRVKQSVRVLGNRYLDYRSQRAGILSCSLSIMRCDRSPFPSKSQRLGNLLYRHLGGQLIATDLRLSRRWYVLAAAVLRLSH